jgi:D-serine deaminase-like pyridoxal phosphate-dependent protein
MANAGINDILIANEVVGTRKIQRLMALAQRCDIMVAVDNPTNLALLNEAAAHYQVCPRILVEINIGHNRCGAASAPNAVALCRQVVDAPNLKFCGIMGYEGHVVDLADQSAREDGAQACLQRLVDTRQAIETAGIAVDIVSSSATGDYYIATNFDGITEVQAGSYALMDAAYAKLNLGFKHALSVLTTIISCPTAEQLITDAGLKSLTPEHGLPLVKDYPKLEVHALSEEHGRLRTLSGDSALTVGDILEFIPGHGCTTANLHDEFYAVRRGHLEAIWSIAARGKVK